MLSRVADSLYWMGRYVERAENVARLLLVTSDFTVELEGLNDVLAQAEWDDVIAALPGESHSEIEFSRTSGLAMPYIDALLFDETNPISVRFSLGKARENARSIREAITWEMFSTLNEAYQALEGHRRKRPRDPVAGRDITSKIHYAILIVSGAIEHTLAHDDGWTFLKLGETLERTLRTLRILRVKLPSLRSAELEVDPALFYARWRSLLRTLASLENFRQNHGAHLVPHTATQYLLFDEASPRSIRRGIATMKQYLDIVTTNTSDGTTAGRIFGKLLATITYDETRVIADANLDVFLEETAARLAEAHDAITDQYFRV